MPPNPQWRCGQFAFDLCRPLIMGIVNATPDSFSDGGQFHHVAAAVAHGLDLLAAGADILDVGGESTRPGAAAVDAKLEQQRVLPIIEQLAARGAAVSVDTTKPEVMKNALNVGACIINDVGGFSTPQTISVAANCGCGVVIMHMRGVPQTMQDAPHYDDLLAEVGGFLRQQAQQLQNAGVHPSRICIDPGIGFGKTRAHNLQLMRNLSELGDAYPILLGVSRKSWLSDISNLPAQRDTASAIAAAILSQRGASILRVHNVAATRDALSVVAELAY